MKLKLRISFGMFVMLLMSVSTFAYDDQVTHRKITEKAVDIASIETYLIRDLGLTGGLTTAFPVNSGNSIIFLLMEGSKLEDDPPCRASNHFHNPLQAWSSAGITSIDRPLCLFWDVTSSSTRHSALVWATGYDNYNGPVITRSNQQMGWDKAREYYRLALTSETKTVREDYFAKTFQSVGQVIHLLQDMAVPAHVRNDFWNSHILTGLSNPYEYFVSRPGNAGLISSLNEQQVNSVTPPFARLTDFWDTTDGTVAEPPQITNPLLFPQASAGLAEYTNANFVSEGTLFTGFTHPQIQINQNMIVHEISDPFNPGTTVRRPYYIKTDGWETGHRLAGVNYTYFRNPESGTTAPDIIIPPIDNYVHKDYAQKLLPRAVGYSAGLLNYFFRGEMDVRRVQGGIIVKNTSAEPMTTYVDPATNDPIGEIDVYTDDPATGARSLLAHCPLADPSACWPNPPGSLDSGAETELIPIPRLPDGSIPLKHIIVFRGRLGSEDGAVAGRVWRYAPIVYYIADQGGADQILRTEADGSSTVVYDNQGTGLYLSKLSLSPDGRTLAYVGRISPDAYNGFILLLDIATGSVTPLATGNSPGWSPDGTRIAFSRELERALPAADEQIFIIDLATRVETQLTDLPSAGHYHAAWSPDGSAIAHSRRCQGTSRNGIHLMDPAGGSLRPLTCQTGGTDVTPAWSPDGGEIAFTRLKQGGHYYELHKIEPASGAVTKLTEAGTSYSEYAPAWSPDGTLIAVSSYRDGDPDVLLVDAQSGGYLLNLTSANPGSNDYPQFGK